MPDKRTLRQPPHGRGALIDRRSMTSTAHRLLARIVCRTFVGSSQQPAVPVFLGHTRRSDTTPMHASPLSQPHSLRPRPHAAPSAPCAHAAAACAAAPQCAPQRVLPWLLAPPGLRLPVRCGAQAAAPFPGQQPGGAARHVGGGGGGAAAAAAGDAPRAVGGEEEVPSEMHAVETAIKANVLIFVAKLGVFFLSSSR